MLIMNIRITHKEYNTDFGRRMSFHQDIASKKTEAAKRKSAIKKFSEDAVVIANAKKVSVLITPVTTLIVTTSITHFI